MSKKEHGLKLYLNNVVWTGFLFSFQKHDWGGGIGSIQNILVQSSNASQRTCLDHRHRYTDNRKLPNSNVLAFTGQTLAIWYLFLNFVRLPISITAFRVNVNLCCPAISDTKILFTTILHKQIIFSGRTGWKCWCKTSCKIRA